MTTGLQSVRKAAILLLLGSAILPMPVVQAQTPMAFDFDITLSDKAAKTLTTSGEGISLSAIFYGIPKKGAENHANEVGQIDLGRESADLPGRPVTAHVMGSAVPPDGLAWIDGPVMVNVNVFSSRKSSDDNILSCDLIEGDIQAVRSRPITVHCSLISENIESQLKP